MKEKIAMRKKRVYRRKIEELPLSEQSVLTIAFLVGLLVALVFKEYEVAGVLLSILCSKYGIERGVRYLVRKR